MSLSLLTQSRTDSMLLTIHFWTY